ncbi:MAG: hypothetical protein R3F43_08065 [bacterium]
MRPSWPASVTGRRPGPSLPLLRRGVDVARHEDLAIHFFIHGDMRDMDFHEEFDAACLLDTSFGYHGRRRTDDECAASSARCARAGACWTWLTATSSRAACPPATGGKGWAASSRKTSS